jgi:hypothetical protein
MPSNSVSIYALGTSTQSFAGSALPLSLAPLGLPSCNLLVAPEFATAVVARRNKAVLQLQIPSSTVLAGARLYAQATLPAATPAGFEVTNGLVLRIGSR